jgi:hypothetical protein
MLSTVGVAGALCPNTTVNDSIQTTKAGKNIDLIIRF